MPTVAIDLFHLAQLIYPQIVVHKLRAKIFQIDRVNNVGWLAKVAETVEQRGTRQTWV